MRRMSLHGGKCGPALSQNQYYTHIVTNPLCPYFLKQTTSAMTRSKRDRKAKRKSIFAMSYKDMERGAARATKEFGEAEVRELLESRFALKSASEYWKRYYGGTSKKDTEDAVCRLEKWHALEHVLIPDNGADKTVMAGDAWILTEIPGEKIIENLRPFGLGTEQKGLDLKIMKGKTCYVAPDGTPIAILVVNWGSAKPEGDTCESLLAEAQLRFLGCKDRTIGGMRQFYHHSWGEPIHCLPRGEGYLIPIKRPTKQDLEELPHWNVTADYHDCNTMLQRMVEDTAGLGSLVDISEPGPTCIPDTMPGQKRDRENGNQGNRRKKKPKLRRGITAEPSAPDKRGPSPTLGPRKETAEDVAKALEEWRKILVLPDTKSVEKTLRVNTAEAVDLECEKRSYPKAIMRTRFPFLRPKYLGEACFTDVIEWKAGGQTHYQMTFLTQMSKYPLVVDIATLKHCHEAVEKFVREVGVPTVLVSDGAKGINKAKKMKKLAGKLHMGLKTTEAYKANGNKVERLNGTIKSKSSRLMSECNIEPIYTGYVHKYVGHVHKYTAHVALNGRSPTEALSGETGDVSHLRFCMGSPVWYCSSDKEYPMRQMLKGVYLGPAESTGDECCHHILPLTQGKQAQKKPKSKRRLQVIQRSYVTIRDPSEKSFREVHSTYERGCLFPRYLFPSRQDREGKPWNVMKAMERSPEEPMDPEYVQRAHARRQPIVPKELETQELPQVPGEDELHQMADKFREELQSAECHQDPDAAVEYSIIGHNMRNGLVKLRVINTNTGLIVPASFEDCRSDLPNELAHYIEENGVGKKRGRRPERPCFTWAKELLRLQREIIRRVRRTTWKSNTYDVLGGMGAAHKIGKIRRVSAKAKRRMSTGTRIKYGVEVPANAEEAFALDKKHGNTMWEDAIAKEVDALMKKGTLNFPTSNDQRMQMALDIKAHKYQYAATWIIFDVKPCGKRKARLVIGGHMVDSGDKDKFCTHMSSESSRILMTIADHMGYSVKVGDINTAYLCATTKEKIYTIGGIAFVKLGHAQKVDDVGIASRAQYGLGTSGFEWYMMLAEQLRALGYRRSRGDPDVWMRENGESHYDYIGTYTDDIMIVSMDTVKVAKELEQWYTFKGIEAPVHHLGVDYVKGETSSGKTKWQLGSFTYVREAIAKLENLLKEEGIAVDPKRVRKNPMHSDAQPELLEGPLCSDNEHTLYMQLIGIYLWLVQIGRCDIGYAVSSLSRFSAMPRREHLEMAQEILYYLRKFPDKRIIVDASPMPLCKSARRFTKSDQSTMKALYPEAVEEIDPKFPTPRGKPIQTSVWFDANFAHDKKSRKSCEGFMLYMGSTLVKAKSKRQGSIASSTYVSEIHAGRTAAEEVMDLRYLLRSLGLNLDGPTHTLGDNESSIKSVTDPASPLNKRHVGISYHTARECEAAQITIRYHVDTKDNLSDGLTKALKPCSHYTLYKDGGPIFCKPVAVQSNAEQSA